MIELRVLGEIRLRTDEGAEIHTLLRQPKRLALLAYLASPSPGTWHRRDMVLALFWPDLDTSHARTSLRNGLYVIRQALGEEVLRNRGDEEISIDPERLRTDLAEVWDGLRNGRPDDAIANYGGDLLTGLFPPDSEGFQRWLDTERTRLKVSVCTAGMARVEQLEREGNVAQALGTARRIAEINPDGETIVRKLMSLHESIGDRAGGLAVFDSYSARLASDFEADPAPETVEVANRLRSSTSGFIANRIAMPMATASAQGSSIAAADAAGIAPRHRLLPYIAGAFALLVIAVMGAWKLSRSPSPPSIGRSAPLTSAEGLQVEASISPNGRLVAYAKGNSSRLRIFVQRIGGGPALPLTGDSTSVELMPRWSPDDDELLFLSRNNAYASPAFGGTPRIIAKGTDGDGVVRSASWSPSGDSVAIVRHDSLFVQPLRGPGSRQIGRGYQLHSCVWAPTGKWIACVSGNWIAFTPGPLFGNAAPSRILLFPVAGGDAVDISGNDFENTSPAWSADGRFLWFLSDRDGGATQAYSARIGDDGRVDGRLVGTGIKAESISFSASRAAYTVATKKANVWSLPIPRDTAVTIASAKQMTEGNQVAEVMGASRDGKWLMYDSDLAGNADIYRIATSGGTPVRLTEDARRDFAPDPSPDNSEFAWHRYIGITRRLFVGKIDGGPEQEIATVKGDNGVPRWSPDGNAIVAWSHDDERGSVFVVRRDSKGNWMRPSWRLSYGQLPIWSHNGKSIAFVRLDGRVQIIPADSGAVRTVYEPKPGDPLAIYIVWSKHADTIWMVGQRGHDQSIWALSLSTGRPRMLVHMDEAIRKTIGPGFAADSSHFYFPVNERLSNVRWAELTSH